MGFRQAVIAVGSRPVALPETEFDGRLMDSSTALKLEDVPEKLLVVGGGYVGLEMGSVYASLGSKITVVDLKFLGQKRFEEAIRALKDLQQALEQLARKKVD